MKRGRFARSLLLLLVCAVPLAACDWLVSAQQRIERAEKKVAAADDRGALIELQNAVRAEPGDIRARLLLAEISLRLGDPKSAEKELQEATRHGATAEQTGTLTADVRLALREFDQLLSLIDSKELPLQEPARSSYRGSALLGMNRLDQAEEAFKQALASDPKWTRARLGTAEVASAQGHSDAALEQVEQVLAAEPQNAIALLLKGTVLARRGDYRAAAAALSAARDQAAGQLSVGQQIVTFAMLTEAQMALGNLEGARAAHAQLLQRSPESTLTRMLAARLAMAQQDYPNAVAEAQKVVTAAPELIPAKMLLGAALLAQGHLNQAETQLAEVVQRAPENMEARKLLARANLQLQRPDVALQVLTPVQQSDVTDPQLDALLGWANLQRGDETKAIALLERSVQAQPANDNLKLDLATAYLTAGEHAKAIALLRSLPNGTNSGRRNSLLVSSVLASQGVAAARVEMERVVAAAPEDVPTLNMAAAFYAQLKDFAQARKLLARSLAQKPADMNTLMSQARMEMVAGDYPAAAAAIAAAVKADPSDMPARLMQVEITGKSGDVAAATTQLESIRATDTAAVEPRLVLARLYLQQKKTKQAEDVIRELRTRAQNEAPVADAVGRYYLDAGSFEEALSWFRIAARAAPANGAYAMNVSRAQLALGNNVGAQETLQAALTAQPDSVQVGAALVMLDLREGRRDAAAARVAALKKMHPTDASVATLEGDVAMASKAYKEAALAYATAARIAPSGAVAVRAYRANQLGGAAQPTAPLEAWLQRQPADAGARMVLAEAFASTGQHDRAIQEYEKVTAAERPSPMALNNLAWLYHEQGDARAGAMAKRAYTAAPNVPAIADTYGWILVKSGDVKQGLPILQKAVADSKSQPDIRFHYAAALAQDGQRDEARRELRALTQGDAKFASAAEAQKLLAELGG